VVWAGKKVVLAVGVKDVYPDIEGYDAVWGRGVYHCLFCDGFEDRGSPSAGVLAIGDIAKLPPALHLARMAKRLAEKVVVYTNGAHELESQIAAALGKDPVIVLDNRRVTRLEKVKEGSSELVVHLEDGTKVSHGFAVSCTHLPSVCQLPRNRWLICMHIGPQAKEPSQRAVCPTAGPGAERDGRHQDESAVL
jgi:thioredoxin reductase